MAVRSRQRDHSMPVAPLRWAVAGLFPLHSALAADVSCLNYYTIGDTKCRPAASTPLEKPEPVSSKSPELVPPPSEVDRFLDNYGKPPREFVEFYLNPTPENAARWASAYQQIIEKGKALSKAWSEAEQTGTPPAAPTTPITEAATDSATRPPAPPVMPAAQSVNANLRFGGLAIVNEGSQPAGGGVRQTPVNLTYYFSQTCPYCARMTPNLSIISRENAGKLAFTCVDVTPLGADNRPEEAFITSKLPCKWRLPEEGEVEREGVNLTPTTIIRKEGGAPVRLFGYVPLSQLRQYF